MSASRLLLVIVAMYVALAVAYAWATPRWQNPDEPAHYNYAREIADHGRLPVLQAGDYDQTDLERLKASRFAGNPDVSRIRYESYQPPLYYLVSGLVVAATPGEAWDLHAMRLLSIVSGVLILVVIFSIGRAVAPDQPDLALGAVVLIALIPQHVAMTAAANNDALGELLLGMMALTAILRVRGMAERRFVAIGGLLLGLALLTKITAYTGALLLLVGEFAAWRLRPQASSGPWRTLAALALVAALISGWWFLRNGLEYGSGDILGLARHDQVVIGQPRTEWGLKALRHCATVTFQSFWAQFGWMGVPIDSRLYWLLALLSLTALCGLVLLKFRLAWRLPRWQTWSLGLLALQAALIAGVMLVYNLTFIQAQGRYLFPASAAIGVFGALGLRQMIARPRATAALCLLGGAAAYVLGAGTTVLAAALALAVVVALTPRLTGRWPTLAWMGLALALLALNVVCLVVFVVPGLTPGA